jgi:hypothetical protein
MLNINATRHLDAGFGVYGISSSWIGERPDMAGKCLLPAAENSIHDGVGDEHTGKIMGPSAALC